MQIVPKGVLHFVLYPRYLTVSATNKTLTDQLTVGFGVHGLALK